MYSLTALGLVAGEAVALQLHKGHGDERRTLYATPSSHLLCATSMTKTPDTISFIPH